MGRVHEISRAAPDVSWEVRVLRCAAVNKVVGASTCRSDQGAWGDDVVLDTAHWSSTRLMQSPGHR
jgi:hypothetical protein